MAHNSRGTSSAALPPVISDCIQRLGKKDDWEVREQALLELQAMCDPESNDVQEHTEMFSQKDVLKALHKPLEAQIRDLRSAIVREACKFISQLAMLLGDSGNLLYHLLLPAIAKVRTSGNKVIAGHIDSCCVDILHFGHPRNAISVFTEGIIGLSKSKEVREYSLECLQIILNHWHHQYLERDADDIERTILLGLGDASPDARSRARHCYWSLAVQFPDRARRVYRQLDTRTRNLLDRMSSAEKSPVQDQQLASPPLDQHGNSHNTLPSFNEVATSSYVTSRGQPVVHSVDLLESDGNSQGRSSSVYSLPPSSSDGVSTTARHPHSVRRQTHPTVNKSSVASGGSTHDPLPEVGDIVIVEGNSLVEPHAGHVRYVGQTRFASGIWVGVELELPRGKNDGSVKDVQYFSCRPGYGIFVRPEMVSKFSGLRGPQQHQPSSNSATPPSWPQSSSETSSQQHKVAELLHAHRENLEDSLALLKNENELLANLETRMDSGMEVDRYLREMQQALRRRQETLEQMWAAIDAYHGN